MRDQALIQRRTWTLAGAALLLGLLLARPAEAEPLGPRGDARIAPEGTWTVGVFNPLTWVPLEGLELSTHPLLSLTSPNLGARYALLTPTPARPLGLVVEGGLAVPWGAFSFGPPLGTQGYLTPSCKVHDAEPARGDTCQEPGVFGVGRAGLAASWGLEHPVTVRLDAAFGAPLSGERPLPLDTLAFIDVALAPIFNGWRAHLGVRYDRGLLPWLRAAAEADVYRIGQGEQGDTGRDLWIYAAWAGLAFQTSASTRLDLGAVYWNSDQRRVILEEDSAGFSRFVHVRSHDLLPTADFLWTW